MALGRKTGGRRAGTPNRATSDVRERLAELGCDPIEGMALIAMDMSNDAGLRGRMFAELAGYLAPKRKAVEIVEPAQEHPPPTLIINFVDPPAETGQLAELEQ